MLLAWRDEEDAQVVSCGLVHKVESPRPRLMNTRAHSPPVLLQANRRLGLWALREDIAAERSEELVRAEKGWRDLKETKTSEARVSL